MFLRRRSGRLALIFCAYFIVAILATWPLISVWGHSLPGSSTDSYVHYWNGWWVREAVRTGQSVYYSTYIFYPQGVSLVLHNLAWLSIIPWLLFQLFLPGIVAYNLVLLINLALCGFSAFVLAEYLTGSRLAAFSAGLIYLAWPFRTAQLDHPNLISTYWLPVALLFIIQWTRGGRTRHALAGGVTLALVGYARWQMLIPAAFVIGLYLAATLPMWATSRRAWSGLLLTAAVAALLLAPPVMLLVSEWQTTITSRDDLLREGEEAVMQTDLLAYITPGSSHPVWGDLFAPHYDRYYAARSPGRRFDAYIGLTAMVLAGVGLWRRRGESVPWLLVALALIALAMGAALRVNGELYPAVPTLYRLLEPLYVVRLIRVPDRFNMTLALPVAMMAAYGLVTLLSRFKERRMALSAALPALILFEYLAAPIPLLDAQVSPVYRELAQTSSPSVILNLPMDQQRAKSYMFAQTAHGRPIVQGKVARIPPGSYAHIESQPWLIALHQFNEMAPWLTDVSRQLSALAQDNIDHIVLHKGLAGPERTLRWQRYLVMDPLYEDEHLAIYATTPQAGVHFALLQEMAPSVGPVKALIATDCVRAGDALGVDIALGAEQSTQQAYAIDLLLRSAAGDVVQRASEQATLDRLAGDSLLWRYLTLQTPATLQPGFYELSMALLPEGQSGGGAHESGGAWRIGRVAVSEGVCRHEDLPASATAVDARFGNQLRLLGYEVQHDGQRLQLTLYWRMMQHMNSDYKVFVHIFAPETGVPVAQDDMMPLRGAYPTRFWAAGETVVDRITVDLETAEAVPGSYGLAVGVYNPQTLERLPLVDGGGNAVSDGRLVLQGEIVQIGVEPLE